MKNLFIWMKKWVLKYKKGLVYGIFSLLIFQFCFFSFGGVQNEVFADWGFQNEAFDTKIKERQSGWSFLTKTAYVLIYPMLVLAWKLCDNSFVYWEDFWFDVVLWKLWNIVKNLSLYTLWFLFLYKVFRYVIYWKDNMKEIIRDALIAWIWIQASWFVMSALIDVSTILAYSIWWLPVSILKQTNNGESFEDTLAYNPYVLKTLVDADAKDYGKYNMYLTDVATWAMDSNNHAFYISECKTFSFKGSGVSEELILAPKMIYYSNGTGVYKTKNDSCHFYGQVYYFKSLHGNIGAAFQDCVNKSECEEKQMDYDAVLSQTINSLTGKDIVKGYIDSATILQIWDAHIPGWVVWGVFDQKVLDSADYWLDPYNKNKEGQTSRLQDIMDGNSYVGIFSALYSSLLNLWKWIIPLDAWLYPSLLNVALSLWHVLAIGIPLIAVSIIFIMRVGLLRLAIALAPFIVLATCFKEIEIFMFKWEFLKYLKLENLIWIIFSPAIICFAISMSAVLVTVISNLNFDINSNVVKPILGWLVRLDIWWLSVSIAKLVISVFWIAITWFLVWAAIQTSKLWDSKIVTWFKDSATAALWSLPIVPIVWEWPDWNLTTEFIWAKAAFGSWWIVPKALSTIESNRYNKETQAIEDILNPDRVKWRQDEAYKTTVLGLTSVPQNWTNFEIDIKSKDWRSSYKYSFDQVSPDKKTGIIDAINSISDASKRALFGKSKPTITFNDWKKDVTYQFDLKSDENPNGTDMYVKK